MSCVVENAETPPSVENLYRLKEEMPAIIYGSVRFKFLVLVIEDDVREGGV